jgi:hypothetical protein
LIVLIPGRRGYAVILRFPSGWPERLILPKVLLTISSHRSASIDMTDIREFNNFLKLCGQNPDYEPYR